MIGRGRLGNGACAIVQVLLLVWCVATGVFVRRVIQADTLSAFDDLALTGMMLVAVASSAAIALRLALSSAPTPRTARPNHIGFFAIPVALLLFGGLFVKASCADVSIELESLVRASASAEPETTIALGPAGADVRLSGPLTVGAAWRLDALLKQNPLVKRIHLTSEGGLADEGQAIGDVIAAHGLTTYVPDFCVSACALAFVRGNERLLLPSARIGFHAPYEEGLFGTLIEDDSSAQRAAFLAAGLQPGFVTEALAIAPTGLWIPSPERLIAAHVATRVVDPYRFPDSNLDGGATWSEARALLLRNFSVLAPFDVKSPAIVDRIASWYHDAYWRGLSEGEVIDALSHAISVAVASALIDAEDETLVRAANHAFDAMAGAAKAAPHECLKIGATGNAISIMRYREGFAAIVTDAINHPRREGLRSARVDAGLRASTCDEARAVYAAVLRGSDREVASFMRRVLAEPDDVERVRTTTSITRASMTGSAP